MELVVAVVGLLTALVGIWQTYLGRQAVVTGPAPAAGPTRVPPAASGTRMAVGKILRDAGLIILATGILGFLIGAAYADSSFEDALPVLGLVNIACLLVGFTISAARIDGNRWKHLAAVGGVVWIFGIVNVFAGFPVESWFAGIVIVAVCAAVAGAVSLAISKP